MASTKFEISKKDRNGAFELMVRFCYDRKHSYRLHTLIWVPQTAWNASKDRLIIPRIQSKEQKQLSQLQAQVDDLYTLSTLTYLAHCDPCSSCE